MDTTLRRLQRIKKAAIEAVKGGGAKPMGTKPHLEKRQRKKTMCNKSLNIFEYLFINELEDL